MHGKQLAGIALAIFGVLVLIEDSLNGQHVAMLGFMLTLAAAFSWACGNIFNKKIMSHSTRPAVMSLVIWSALIPIIPFFVASLILDGSASMIHSLVTIDMTTILSLMYLAFVEATPANCLPCNRSPKVNAPSTIVKNACACNTSEASPAGIPKLMAQKRKANCAKLMVNPYPSSKFSGTFGRATKKIAGKATSIKRKPASISGGML